MEHVHSRRSERSIVQQDVKSMLFADIVGYSKLTEAVIPIFVREFLGRVSEIVSSSPHAPISVNTWGDAAMLRCSIVARMREISRWSWCK